MHQSRISDKLGREKLAPRLIGPFTVLKVIGEAYTLDIPTKMKLHPTFYVRRLKRYRLAALLDPADDTEARTSPLSALLQRLLRLWLPTNLAVLRWRLLPLPVRTQRSVQLLQAPKPSVHLIQPLRVVVRQRVGFFRRRGYPLDVSFQVANRPTKILH